MLKVNLGCGMRKDKGWFGIDIRPFKGVDYVMNIGRAPLPFEDDSVDEMKSIHVFEHLYPEELFYCFNECFRVIKATGFLHVEVPIFPTRAWLIHPDPVAHH